MTKKSEITLAQFISENKDLISVIGIFVALILFSGEIVSGELSKLLSLFLLTGFLLLWLELWTLFPSQRVSMRLNFFEQYIVGVGLIIVVYWILKLRTIGLNIAIDYLSIIISIIIISILSDQIKKYQIFNRLFHTHKNEKQILRFYVALALIFIIFFPIHFLVKQSFQKYDLQINKFIKDNLVER